MNCCFTGVQMLPTIQMIQVPERRLGPQILLPAVPHHTREISSISIVIAVGSWAIEQLSVLYPRRNLHLLRPSVYQRKNRLPTQTTEMQLARTLVHRH